MFRVLCADSLAPEGIEVLELSEGVEVANRKGITAEQLLVELPEYDALIVRSRTQVDKTLLNACPRLQVVGRAGIGVDNIDVREATRCGVVVMNTPDANTVTTAEHTIALMMSAARRVPQGTSSLKAGRWDKKALVGVELSGKTLGVVGLGNIGRIVADRAQGLKMRVKAFDPFLGREAAERLGIELCELDALIDCVDILTVHTPLNDHTRGMIGDAQIERMRRGVILINCARGGIYDESALVRGLESKQLGAVALDVFVEEPPPANHPLLGHERVVCTPHLGASTQEAQIGVAVAVAEQVAAFAQGAGARNALNLPRLDTKSSKKLSSLIDTAERAAAMCAQITRGKPTAIEVILHGGGDSALMQPLGTAACVAVLRQSLGGSVNMVNGRLNADERGMSVVESRTEQPVLGYSNAIEVRVSGEDTHHVIATQFGNGETRVVAVDGVRLEAVPEGEILLIANKDMPGAVGQIGSILGDNGINISRMQLGLHAESGNALTAVNVDRSVPLEVVSALESIEQVVAVSAISL